MAGGLVSRVSACLYPAKAVPLFQHDGSWSWRDRRISSQLMMISSTTRQLMAPVAAELVVTSSPLALLLQRQEACQDGGRQDGAVTRGGPNPDSELFHVIPMALFCIVGSLLALCGDVELNPGPGLSDRPTWPQLIFLRCPAAGDQPLKVIKWITSCEPTQCADLAHLLLQDDVTVKKLQMKNPDNDQFVRAVLREWLNRADDDHNESAAPRTWAALAECVQDADLPGTLAKAIRDATAPLPPAAVQNTVQPASHLPDPAHSLHLSDSSHSPHLADPTCLPHLPDSASHAGPALFTPHLSAHAHSPNLPDPAHLPHLCDPASQAAGPTHSTPHLLITYQHYLKDLYSPEYPGYLKPQFTRHRPEQIVNLALVHREDDGGDKLQRECLLYQLHGNIDLIQQKKTPLTKDQITVLPKGETARTVLIEGAPGIGKTTLLWQLCHQWADGELLQQWELVILVQLRDETTRTAQCLSDLLYHQPDDSIRETICREIEKREGENVLFIFDGYDELSDDQRTDSIFTKLLRRQSRELRKATVVVSSRSFATKTLPHQFKNSLDQHVEIVGFNEQDIETYLTSACQDNPDMLRDLKSYISTQAFISAVLYNPLHCTIVTELYLQYWQRGEKGFAPCTLTQLYKALVLNLLRRHLGLDTTPSWTDLPSDVSHQLNQLGKLAARGIEQRKYIFDNVPSDTLGLIHSVKQVHGYRTIFTHLTLQEFLAGRYWSQLPPQQLTELLQRQDLFPIQQYLEGMHREEDEESLRVTHWSVLLFLAGLTTIPTELITPWTDHSSTHSGSSTDDEPVEPHPSLCQLLFESQSIKLVSTVFSGRKVQPGHDKMPSPLDWFATGYCIAHSDTTSSWSVEFGNSDSTLSFQAFSSGLHYSSTTTHRSGGTGSLTELTLIVARTSPVSPYLETFPSLFPYSQAITVLQLYGDLYSDDRGVPVLQHLSHYCPQLRELRLPRLLRPLYLSLVPQLPQHTLDTLSLVLPLMKDDSVLGHHLQQCLALKHIILYDQSVNNEINVTPFMTSISPLLAGQIEHLELHSVSIVSGAGVGVLVHSLTSPHSSLYKLELWVCIISSSDFHHLTTAIATSNLIHLTTVGLRIDVSAAEGLATALTHSKTLQEVVVKAYPVIDEDAARVLAEAMNHSRVKKLTIGRVRKGTVIDCSYPRGNVNFEYTL